MDHWDLGQSFDFHGRQVRHGVMGQGPAVVVAHGTPWSSYNLRHLIRGLARDHTVYFFDLMGYGQSDQRQGDVSLAVQNQVLAALVDHWGLDSPAAVGHDFGGATVLRAHLLSGVDFAKLVLIDPVALSPWGSPFFAHVRRHEAAFAGVPDYIHEAILRAYIATAAHRELAPEVMDRTIAPWTGPLGKPAFYRQIAQADSKHTDEIREGLTGIDRPALILWGAEDAWIPLERGEKLAGLIPGAELALVPDSGHLVIEEEPDALLARIRPFLAA